MSDSPSLTVSVTTLCDFAARRGSLDYRYTPSVSATEGADAHRRLQSRREPGYQPEYSLQGYWHQLLVQGRSDGHFTYKDGQPALEEIKTYRGDISRISADRQALHWAQLKVYGALFCATESRESVWLRLTYYNLDSGDESPHDQLWQRQALFDYRDTLCAGYARWAENEQQHRQTRDDYLRNLVFPYPAFRSGQRELSETVYKGIATQTHLLLQAPTGSGKTLGVLFPSLKALAYRSLDRAFFLTMRTTGRTLALDGIRQLLVTNRSTALAEAQPLRILEMTAKEKSCENPDRNCHGDDCPLADGFYNRLEAAREDAIQTPLLDQPNLRTIALRHQLCPYFFAQEMAHWSDLVVADVNLYFDQTAQLYGLTCQDQWRSLVICDEAHNLIDRARGMYSGELPQKLFLNAQRRLPATLKSSLSSVLKIWREMVKDARDSKASVREDSRTVCALADFPDGLLTRLHRLSSRIADALAETPDDRDLQESLLTISSFLKLVDVFGEHSLLLLDISDTAGESSLLIENQIPADHLQERFARAYVSILFSATLTPAEFYSDMLGLPAKVIWKSLQSPFAASQADVRLITYISTRLQDRAASVSLMGERIVQLQSTKPGNYLIYTSSFSYLNAVADHVEKNYPNLTCLRQRPNMSEPAREEFINNLRTRQGVTAFAVLGGAFAEGIDLPGQQLIGVVVATLGLPPADFRGEKLKQRLHARFGYGYQYAYLYPGLRKVIQAAGRLIRTTEDAGTIELIDDRFSRAEITALLPDWWQPRFIESPNQQEPVEN